MAANADASDWELSETTAAAPSATAPDEIDEGSPASPDDGEPISAAGPDAADGGPPEAEDYEAVLHNEADDGSEDATLFKRSMSHVRAAALVGMVMVIALIATVGWLGFRAYQSHQALAQRQLFLQVGRQGALNLTTIDWQHADADVQRLLDSATGQFLDQFSRRKQPFIDVVKKAKSTSVGSITEAGLESESGDKARVLVAVSIKSSDLGAADQPPREWRVQISMEKSGDQVKISNVAFVQ